MRVPRFRVDVTGNMVWANVFVRKALWPAILNPADINTWFTNDTFYVSLQAEALMQVPRKPSTPIQTTETRLGYTGMRDNLSASSPPTTYDVAGG